MKAPSIYLYHVISVMLDLAKCVREAVVVPRFTKAEVHAKLHNNLFISTCSLYSNIKKIIEKFVTK